MRRYGKFIKNYLCASAILNADYNYPFSKRSTEFAVNVFQQDDPIIGYRLLKMKTVSSMSHAVTGMRCNKFMSIDAKGRHRYSVTNQGERGEGRDYTARVIHELMRLHLIRADFPRENRVGAFPFRGRTIIISSGSISTDNAEFIYLY